MNNFDFYNPTHIIFGKDRMGDLSTLVPATAKVLILVGGASAEKSGTLAEVCRPLSQNSCRYPKLRMIRSEATPYETKNLPR